MTRQLVMCLIVLLAVFAFSSTITALAVGTSIGTNITVDNSINQTTNSSNQSSENGGCVIIKDPKKHIWHDCSPENMQIRTGYPDYSKLDNRGLIPGVDRDEYSSKSKGGHQR